MSIRNLSDTAPAAPSGKRNVKFQMGAPYDDGTGRIVRDVSAYFDPIGSVLSKSADYPGVAADSGIMLVFNGTSLTYTLPNPVASSLWIVAVRNDNATALTIARNSRTIDGASANITLSQGQSCWIFSDGTNYHTIRGASSATWGTITGTLSAQTDLQSALDAKLDDGQLDTDGALTANSDLNIATQKATKTYVDGLAASVASSLALKAPLASPSLTGNPTAPTPSPGDSDTSIATTAFVQNAIAAYAPGGSGALLLKTNGTTNGSQVLLNLLQGLGITIADDGSGGVTITGGFAHGGNGSDGALVFDGTSTVAGLAPTPSAALVLTSVAAATGIYQGTITGGASNAYAGLTFTVAGFVNGANNGTFLCVLSSATQLTLVNQNSVTETHAGTATVSQPQYILARDLYCTNMTVNSGVILKAANCRIFGTGILTVNGIVMNDGSQGEAGRSVGNSASGGAGGTVGKITSSPGEASASMTVLAAGAFGAGNPASATGGNGGTTTGTQGAQGGSLASPGVNPVVPGGTAGVAGASGGTGGTGTSGAGGAARVGGTGQNAPSAINSSGNSPSPFLPAFLDAVLTSVKLYSHKHSSNGGGSAGSGGGGDTTNSGAGGGGAGGNGGYGGHLYIAFCNIIVGAAGRISSNGGNGGNGGAGGTRTVGNVGGGGGGAGGTGGTGGIVWLIYHLLTNSGTIQAIGGTHGNGGAKGLPAGTGTNDATAGGTGIDGKDGVVIQIPC